jgi:uncharacterized protein YdeI (YjbR/CyaY-like superfamily)
MLEDQIATGVVHKVPTDMRKILTSNSELREKWNKITPLARNEWICWVTIVKKSETRQEHINRLQVDILKGKKRPCCWPGCPHRNSNAKKWFERKKK